MSETKKKSTRRTERGLSVQAVQESKEEKFGSIRVNTRAKKADTDEKNAEKKVAEKDLKESSEQFETLMLHIDDKKTEPKVILRDVAKEKPIKSTPEKSTHEAKKTTKTKAKVESRPTPKKTQEKLSAKKVKEQEIEKAISMATKLPETSKKQQKRFRFNSFGVARIALAVACLSTAIFAVVYFININSADISLRVAAAQSGIEASYPSYIPRGYTLVDVSSSNGKITMGFKSSEDESYTITEEQTSWNSDGLFANFVKPTYGDGYTLVEEQGLSLYMGDKWAAWVNGGIAYKLTVDSGNLTKKQIKTIATSV